MGEEKSMTRSLEAELAEAREAWHVAEKVDVNLRRFYWMQRLS